MKLIPLRNLQAGLLGTVSSQTLLDKDWKLCWNAITSNKFADFLAKMALWGDINVLFSSFNLGSLPKELSDIYVADLSECCHVYSLFWSFLCLINLPKTRSN